MLKPLQDFVLIKVDTKEEKKGNVFVVEEWESLPPTGEVVECGPQVSVVKKGDKVQFERYSSIILEDDYRLVKQNGIYGIFS